MTSVTITPKEVEAIMWGLAQIGDVPDRGTDGPADPLFILLQRGHRRPDIVTTCAWFFDHLEGHVLKGPYTQLQADILGLCVSNTSWLDSYDRASLSRAMKTEATAALRSLAYKVETFGIEVSHIPS